ncbi:MAG: 50S ribosomal protein L18 [Patescibacteria group bacterium]|nr:MAG: 50S ribosomal protein L18 [Patescibacteria group bacterium]
MMVKVKHHQSGRARRRVRVRGSVSGTSKRPRLSVFRSSKHVCAQLINDEKGVTLVSSSDLEIAEGSKTERAFKVGKALADKAKKQKIKRVVFDRGGYAYHGRVKAVAEGAREGGLEF